MSESPFEQDYPALVVAVWQNGRFKERIVLPPFRPREPGEERQGLMYCAGPLAKPVHCRPYPLRDGTWRIDLPDSEEEQGDE